MYGETDYQTLCANQAICPSENRMNQQRAIEFVKEWLGEPHYINDSDCWYSCPLSTSDWHDGSGCCNDALPPVCNCGKVERDVKLQELLNYLQESQEIDFSQYFEFWVEE